jgi:antirestriction protein ArdC
MQSQSAIREEVTNRIVAALKSGDVPFWRQTWAKSKNSGAPSSAVTGKPYKGINRILLSLLGHESKWFATYAGWRSLGGQVRRGEHGVAAILYKPVVKKKVNDDGQEEVSSFGLLKTFSLFHISQVDGDLSKFRDDSMPEGESPFVDYGPAEEVFSATGADVRFGGSSAFYSPSEDYIQMPRKTAFSGMQSHEYYSVLAHEMLHWTGHESRLNRLQKFARFGSEAYAIEELTADLGGAFLSSELSIPQSDDISNIAAYLNHWLKVLQRDPSAIFSVAAASSAAVDHLLEYSRPNVASVVDVEADVVMA